MMQFRLHPIGDFLIEHRQRAGEKNRKQQPAEEQACPGMEPIHALCEAFFHG